MNEIDGIQDFVHGQQHQQRQRNEDVFFGTLLGSLIFGVLGRLFRRS